MDDTCIPKPLGPKALAPPEPVKGHRRIYVPSSYVCGRKIPGYWQMIKMKYPLCTAVKDEFYWDYDKEDYESRDWGIEYRKDFHIKQQLEIQRKDLEKTETHTSSGIGLIEQPDDECDGEWQLL